MSQQKRQLPLEWISGYLILPSPEWIPMNSYAVVSTSFTLDGRIIRRSVIVNFRHCSPINSDSTADRLVSYFWNPTALLVSSRFLLWPSCLSIPSAFFLSLFFTLDNVVEARSISRTIVSIQRRDRYIESIGEGMAASVRAFYLAVLLSLV